MATNQQLVTAVLERLNEAGAGEPVDNMDAQKVRDAIPKLFRLLYETNVVLSEIPLDDIPDAQFFPLRSYIARKISGDFGAAGDASLAAESAQAVDELKTLARINRGTRKTLSVDVALTNRRSRGYSRIDG